MIKARWRDKTRWHDKPPFYPDCRTIFALGSIRSHCYWQTARYKYVIYVLVISDPLRIVTGSQSAKYAKRYCTAPFSGWTKSTDRPGTLVATSFACEYSTWFIRRHALRRSDHSRSPPLCESHLLPYRNRFVCQLPPSELTTILNSSVNFVT